MTLLQWSLMWIAVFVAHAQLTMAVTRSRDEQWNKWATVTFATVVAFFILSLTGANGVY